MPDLTRKELEDLQRGGGLADGKGGISAAGVFEALTRLLDTALHLLEDNERLADLEHARTRERDQLLTRLEESEAKNERLRKALEKVVQCDGKFTIEGGDEWGMGAATGGMTFTCDDCGGSETCPSVIARAALQGGAE